MRYAICLLVMVSMVGCGCGEKAGEKVAEKVLEAQTGKKVDLDVDDESMRITTKDGEMTVTSGKSVKLPDNFPKDIPVYKGSALDMAMEVPQGYSLSFTTKDDMSKVSKWYAKEMVGEGWTQEMSMDMEDQKMLVFKKQERGVNLVITPDKDLTRISLTNVK